MVLIETQKSPPPPFNMVPTPGPPMRSNQTPIGPADPAPYLWSERNFQGVPQRIKTVLPHTTPNIDNYSALDASPVGVPQHIKTMIPQIVSPGVYPDTYTEEVITGKPKELGFIIENTYPGGIKQLQGIAQHIKTVIPQIVSPGVYPDTYGPKSLGADSGSFLIGGILGFTLGAIIFTAAGRSFARATAARVTSYIEPKQRR